MRSILNVSNGSLPWLQPDWPAPAHVVAGCTTRQGGVSHAPWDSLNLGDHVNDDPVAVTENRRRLQAHVHEQGTGQLVFLKQVHGVEVKELNLSHDGQLFVDGVITQDHEVCLIVLVADCLPILLTDRAGRWVAALHAGWRGLAGVAGGNVVSQALTAFAARGCPPSELLAWFGPCIGPAAFEVGEDVRQAFVQGGLNGAADFFLPVEQIGVGAAVQQQKWRADLAGLARITLAQAGVHAVYGNDSSQPWCTVANADLFFSHRRDARRLGASGRLGAFIGLRR
jgi:polyphenol oxidase